MKQDIQSGSSDRGTWRIARNNAAEIQKIRRSDDQNPAFQEKIGPLACFFAPLGLLPLSESLRSLFPGGSVVEFLDKFREILKRLDSK
jgi:hypothetical protein